MSTSKYADEGTVAHALAAMCLKENRPAAAYVGRLIRCDDYEHAKLSPSGAHRWVPCPGSHALETRIKFVPRTFSLQVTEDMAAGVQVYLDNLKEYVVSAGQYARTAIELEVPIGHITGEEGATGSADYVILDIDHDELQAHDLKFGQGVEVSAEKNEQLALYLLGVLEKYRDIYGGWKTFRGVIHQPRINTKPSEYVWTREELAEFAMDAAGAAHTAAVAKTFLSGGAARTRMWEDTYLAAGDKQCKFCDAKPNCPAIARAVQNSVGAEFADLDAVTLVPENLDLTQLALKYKALELIESWCKAVAAAFEGRLLAGEKHPDWKLVQGRKGSRAWKSAEEAEAALKSMRVKHDQMYDYSVISPTSAEKLKKAEVIGDRQWEKLQPLITQSDGKTTVVPVSDKRPAIEVTPTLEEFQSLEAE